MDPSPLVIPDDAYSSSHGLSCTLEQICRPLTGAGGAVEQGQATVLEHLEQLPQTLSPVVHAGSHWSSVFLFVLIAVVAFLLYHLCFPSATMNRRPHWRIHMTELWMHVVSKQWVAALQRTYAHPNEAKYRNSLNDTVLHLAVCSAAGPGGNQHHNANNNSNNSNTTNNNNNNNHNNNHHHHLNHSLNYNPPLPFVRALVRAYPEACAVRNESGCTPLHLAVVRGSSVDVIRTVLEAHVGAVAMRNNMGDTPLALLGWTRPERAVVRWAIEEYQWQHQRRMMGKKDGGSGLPSEDATSNTSGTGTSLVPPPPEALIRIWNSACLLVKAAASCRDNCAAAAAAAADDEADDAAMYTAFQDDVGDNALFAFSQQPSTITNTSTTSSCSSTASTTSEEDADTTASPPTFRMVHACCTVPCCPLDIVRLAMQVHPEQLEEVDEFHRLPLHWAIESAFERARNSQRQRQRHLHRAMSRMSSGGSGVANVISSSQYHHPHHSSPYYHGGHDLLDDRLIQIVLDANPGAVMRRDGKSGLYPFMMLAVGEYASLTWSYRALRACPELERIFGAGHEVDCGDEL